MNAELKNFLEGFADAAGLPTREDADEQWAWFSRQLSDCERSSLEAGGYDAGFDEGGKFLALYS